ncbi:hypothetical protein JCM3775_000323 [Rhodotorula graminis]|uniref:F-box domain-containing protein n=1 Tax=Rhodotorula graminis (strain WP1) TaxID=578459 RepID=A0A0P9F8I9_RHOGW|nr:uncharacterized protein RHOBADRAFT_47156 [Rhodotorula graminis WP1]KPV71975.1 hypothetical protein RHOBADRAFT_47156 [Rhodotorula graminis WP1]
MATVDKLADASSAASAPSLGEAIASRLPDETWTQILASLDYRRLLRMRRVCKRFKRLVEDQKFKLFRRGFIGGELKPGKKVAIHPLLSSVDCVGVTVTWAAVLSGCYHDQSISRHDHDDVAAAPSSPSASSNSDGDEDDSTSAKLALGSHAAEHKSSQEVPAVKDDASDDLKEFNGLEYPAAEEFATSPACKELRVSMMGEHGFSKNDEIVVKDSTGVKCDRVLKAIAKYWAKAAPAAAARQVRAENGWPKEHKVCRNEVLSDHRFFEGWRPAVVKANGSVYLEALRFGS